MFKKSLQKTFYCGFKEMNQTVWKECSERWTYIFLLINQNLKTRFRVINETKKLLKWFKKLDFRITNPEAANERNLSHNLTASSTFFYRICKILYLEYWLPTWGAWQYFGGSCAGNASSGWLYSMPNFGEIFCELYHIHMHLKRK